MLVLEEGTNVTPNDGEVRVTEPDVKMPGRRFWLVREEDVSGVSGTGVVAEGIEFSNGQAVLSWLVGGGSLGVYSSINSLVKIHGHGGATQVVWAD